VIPLNGINIVYDNMHTIHYIIPLDNKYVIKLKGEWSETFESTFYISEDKKVFVRSEDNAAVSTTMLFPGLWHSVGS
jgi:hypothetical protein